MSTFNLNEYHLTASFADCSTAENLFIPIPDSGELVKVQTCLGNAITTADSDVVVTADGGATLGTLTVAFTSSAEGDIDTLTLKSPVANYVKLALDGASSTAAELGVTLTIKR